MKTVLDIINEASINAKKRDVKSVKSLFTNGKATGNIKNFGIMTSQNPNSGADFDGMSKSEINTANKKLYDAFVKELKQAHLKYTLADGKFEGLENSFVILNIKLETLKHYAGKYEQTSFWFCYPKDDKLNCEYWQKTDTTAPYDEKKNPYELIESSTDWKEIPDADDYYTVIGKNFKFTINLEYFNEANEEIEKGLTLLSEKLHGTNKEKLLDFSINRIGQTAWYYRCLING